MAKACKHCGYPETAHILPLIIAPNPSWKLNGYSMTLRQCRRRHGYSPNGEKQQNHRPKMGREGKQ